MNIARALYLKYKLKMFKMYKTTFWFLDFELNDSAGNYLIDNSQY
jgi:hypothetical protein